MFYLTTDRRWKEGRSVLFNDRQKMEGRKEEVFYLTTDRRWKEGRSVLFNDRQKMEGRKKCFI